jgi:hypothetical protein
VISWFQAFAFKWVNLYHYTAERDLRMQRLKRAMDLSMKHVYLDKDMQAKQTPWWGCTG